MATTFSSIRTTTHPFTCSATRKPDSKQNNNNWWAPIFGISSEPDYITTKANNNNANNGRMKVESGQENVHSGRAGPEKDMFRGCFTEEKAKALRKKTAELSTFHDIMYHSSIASRLATDVSGEFGR